MNDSYYSIGAMGFYMGQDWTWNQGDWVGIDDTGKITVEYKISKVVTDKTMSGKGTLGDMGVMVANLPDGVYPVDVKISVGLLCVVCVAEVYHVCDAVYQNSGLAASCSCQYKERSFYFEHSLALLVVHS